MSPQNLLYNRTQGDVMLISTENLKKNINDKCVHKKCKFYDRRYR